MGIAGTIEKGRPGPREGGLMLFDTCGGCTGCSTADMGVVGRVESSAEDAREVRDVSTEVATVAGPSGKVASTKLVCASSMLSSVSDPSPSRCGSTTGAPAGCGAGFLLRALALLGGNEPSVKEYHGSCSKSAKIRLKSYFFGEKGNAYRWIIGHSPSGGWWRRGWRG